MLKICTKSRTHKHNLSYQSLFAVATPAKHMRHVTRMHTHLMHVYITIIAILLRRRPSAVHSDDESQRQRYEINHRNKLKFHIILWAPNRATQRTGCLQTVPNLWLYMCINNVRYNLDRHAAQTQPWYLYAHKDTTQSVWQNKKHCVNSCMFVNSQSAKSTVSKKHVCTHTHTVGNKTKTSKHYRRYHRFSFKFSKWLKYNHQSCNVSNMILPCTKTAGLSPPNMWTNVTFLPHLWHTVFLPRCSLKHPSFSRQNRCNYRVFTTLILPNLNYQTIDHDNLQSQIMILNHTRRTGQTCIVVKPVSWWTMSTMA